MHTFVLSVPYRIGEANGAPVAVGIPDGGGGGGGAAAGLGCTADGGGGAAVGTTPLCTQVVATAGLGTVIVGVTTEDGPIAVAGLRLAWLVTAAVPPLGGVTNAAATTVLAEGVTAAADTTCCRIAVECSPLLAPTAVGVVPVVIVAAGFFGPTPWYGTPPEATRGFGDGVVSGVVSGVDVDVGSARFPGIGTEPPPDDEARLGGCC